MKRHLLFAILSVLSLGAVAQDCSDLFISEYVVGSGNNRALEIYNPTDAAVDLFGYSVGRFRDGSGTPMLVDLSGTVPAYGTFVVVVNKRSKWNWFRRASGYGIGRAVADTFVNPVYVQSNSPFYFNGDDAVPLVKGDGTDLVDLVGKIGEDPGTAWSRPKRNMVDN